MSAMTEEATPAPGGTDKFFSKEEVDAMLNSARTQERDKLYPQLSKADERQKAMDDELKELRKFQKAQEKIEADRLKAIEDANRAKTEAEMSAKEFAENLRQETDARFSQMQADRERSEALYQQELKFMKLQNYIQRRVVEESENIAPELVDFISGDDETQVEASIEMLKAKTAQIVENMRQAGLRQRSQMPGVAPAAGTNGVGPMDVQGDRQVSAQEIAGMSMSDYAALRKRVGMPSGSGRGLFD
jgi:hypothetical protein